MASEDVNRIAAGVAILIIGVAAFNAIFAQPELDKMAENTAYSVAEAINQAAYLPATDSEPKLSETNKYVPVIIRMGEPIDALTQWKIAWDPNGKEPDYKMYYEHFPSESAMPVLPGILTTWTESYPWSGGMVSQIVAYSIFRAGMFAGSKVVVAAKLTKWGQRQAGKLNRLSRFPIESIQKTARYVRSYPVALYSSIQGGQSRFGTRLLGDYLRQASIKHPAKRLGRWVLRRGRIQQNFDIYHMLNTRSMTSGMSEAAAEEKNIINAVEDIIDRENLPTSKLFKSLEEGKLVKIQPDYTDFNTYKRMKYYRDTLPYDQSKLLFEWVDEPPASFRWNQIKATMRDAKIWKSDIYKKLKLRASNVGGYLEKIPNGAKNIRRRFSSAISPLKYERRVRLTSVPETNDLVKAYFKNLEKAANEYAEEVVTDPSAIIMLGTDVDTKLVNNRIKLGYVMENIIEYKKMGFIVPPKSALSRTIDTSRYSQKNADDLFSPSTFDDLDSVVRKRYITKFTSEDEAVSHWWRMKKGFDADGLDGINRAAVDKYFTKYINNADEMAMFSDIANGRITTRPGYDVAKKRVNRFIFFDYGKFKNPVFHGGWITQQAELNALDNLDADTDNSLIFINKGEPTAIPLDEEVANYGVKLFRPKPGTDERVPVFTQTLMFYGSIVNNPRYYTVSPCFGTGKVWKQNTEDGQIIYVNISSESCSVGDNCKPEDEDCNPADCANYCYASHDLLWGNDPGEPFALTMGTTLGTLGSCMALQMIGSGGVAAPIALKTCKYPAAAAGYTMLGSLSAKHTQDTACTETKWGYWNWYQASDTMDLLEMFVIGKMGKAGSWTSRIGRGALTDVSLVPQTLGDTVLSWPNVGYNKYGIDRDQILENEAECVWGTPTSEESRERIYGD